MIDSSFSALTFRPPVPGDAERVLELMLRRDVADYGQPDSSIEDLQYDWDHIDLARDAWLAVAPGGALIGYAEVAPWIGALRYGFYVDPSWTGPAHELARDLLDRCRARGAELARDGACQPLARIYLAHTNAAERAIAEAAGFHPARYHFQMRIRMDAPPPPSQWPAGVAVRAHLPGQDDRAVHALIQAAFDRPGRTPQPFDAWQEFMMQPSLFRPELWFLAEAGGQMAGACLCLPYEGIGWVRQLGVAEGHRRRGLGAALLRHAFSEFWKRGQSQVGLAVDADNDRAVGLYEAVGMERARQYDEYQQPIP